MTYTYEDIQDMRKLLIEEITTQIVGGLSVDHLILVEHRLQTMVMAELGKDDVEAVKDDFQININAAKIQQLNG